MSRILIADTETTGLDPNKGHRIVEIALWELKDGFISTNKYYHQYINPERDVPEEAARVHGLTQNFLKDYPTFKEVVKDFWEFLGDDHLVIHNAPFDMKFFNYELKQVGYPLIEWGRVTDTLKMARKKFPGASCSLDSLCKRFNISLNERDLHGALIDTKLLASVYIELTGGKQRDLGFIRENDQKELVKKKASRTPYPQRDFSISDEEESAHKSFVQENFKGSSWGY